MQVEHDVQADRVSARAIGIGAGFLAVMVAWLVGARLFERIWGQPAAAYVAVGVALLSGIVVAALVMSRLVTVVEREALASATGADTALPTEVSAG